MKKSGFILAEVLITLVIIGVIGALTVPSLIQRTQKQEFVTGLKKAYSTLSQVTNQIIMDEGPISSWDIKDGAEGREQMYNLYKKYLNNAKECSSEDGCVSPVDYKYKDGTPFNADNGSWHRRLVLADGAKIYFNSTSSTCSYSDSGSVNICASISVDVNGNKKPNIRGRDFFQFVIKENGIFPMGCDEDPDYYCTRQGTYGGGCACKVLREGAMNY